MEAIVPGLQARSLPKLRFGSQHLWFFWRLQSIAGHHYFIEKGTIS
jgi:hypothetical protein